MALPLLPAARMAAGRNCLETAEADRPALQQFRSYIDRYWLGTVGAERFSVAHQPLRTNNGVESFHRVLNATVGCNRNYSTFMSE